MVAYGALVVVHRLRAERNARATRTATLIYPRNVAHSYRMLLADRGFLHSGLLTAMIQGGLYTMPALMPFALIERVGLTPVQFGIAMALTAGVFMLGAFIDRAAAAALRCDAADHMSASALVLFAGIAFAIGLRLGPPTFYTVWTSVRDLDVRPDLRDARRNNAGAVGFPGDRGLGLGDARVSSSSAAVWSARRSPRCCCATR